MPETAILPIPATGRPPVKSGGSARLVSLDAYRGFIMLAMASAGFGIPSVAKQLPDSLWTRLAWHTDHVAWIGGSFWDMIQPSFMFMVGVALPFSVTRRREQGDSNTQLFTHALVRSFILVALGVFLASTSDKRTNYIFTNVLAQIGLGYLFVFLLVGRGVRVQFGALLTVLIGYWLVFLLYPAPPGDLDLAKYGLKPEDLLPGTFAHWTKSWNFAAAFDRWFLNLFPRDKPFVFNSGGYQTLNFVPSMATMILGLLTGELLRSGAPQKLIVRRLLIAGAVCLALGLLAGATVCPIVKRIWTPSWTLYAGGWTLWILAAFYWAVEVRGAKRWTLPLVVVGMNSIAIYLLFQLMSGWIRGTLKIHLPDAWFTGPYTAMVERTSVWLVLWLICAWLYRRKIFLKI